MTNMTKQQKRDRIDMASLAISAASLGVGIAALCLNEKKEEGNMANRIDSSKYTNRKDLKKAYAKEIKRSAVTDIGYTGTVIVLNGKGEQASYGLVPLDAYQNRKKTASKNTKSKNTKTASKNGKTASGNTKAASKNTGSPNASGNDGMSWVAMEINSRTGGSRQAIVCSSKEEARDRALAMKNAHRSDSRQCRDCVQGYARMDTSRTIDVARWFSGNAGKVYEV